MRMRSAPLLVVACIGMLFGVLSSSASAMSVGLGWDGQQSTLKSAADWNTIQASGTKLVRVQAQWKIVSEHGNWRESPAWEQTYDQYFTLAAERGITLQLYLYGRQTSAAEHQFYLGGERKEWLEFVWTFVQRYGRGGTFWSAHPSLPYKPVTVWEVWNEENLALNNPGGEQVQPRNYAEFFVATSKTITEAQNAVRKAGEPFDTKILVGGIFQDVAVNPQAVQNYFAEIAKNTTLNTEFKSHNSGLGLHPYSLYGNEAQKISRFKESVDSARQALSTYDSSLKPIWITELGWPVQGEGLSFGNPVTPREQAALLTSAFNWLKQESGAKRIEYAAWYDYKDFNDPAWAYHCGLLTRDGAFRPSWFSFVVQTGAQPWKTVAFQNSTGNLGIISPSNQVAHYGLGMAKGTDPAIWPYLSGYVSVFQANTNAMWVYTPWGGPWTNGLAMDPESSPAIAELPNGDFEVAYQGANHYFHTYRPETGAENHFLEMAPGTRPAITKYLSGYVSVFQANTNAMWVYTPWGGPWTNGLAMDPESSPAIAELPNGDFEVAYQGSNNYLHTYRPETGSENRLLGMAAGTSPSIAKFQTGYVVAFQANNNTLWIFTPWGGAWTNGLPMAPGTSPAVAALPNGSFEVAYQGANGNLHTYTPESGSVDRGIAMAPGTSPAIEN